MRILRPLILSLAIFALPGAALASNLKCTTTGTIESGYLFPTDTDGGPCTNIPSNSIFDIINHIFSWIMCSYVRILDAVLGQLYCSMQVTLIILMQIILSGYVALFGAQLLMGVTQLTISEAMTRLLKLALIVTFVTQSDWGIGLAFNFFLVAATEGTVWVLSGVTQASGFNMGSSMMGVYNFLDQLVYNVTIGPFTTANAKVLGFFTALCIVLPPIFLMACYWVWENFLIAARALMTFLLGMSSLAFLISLSPVFLSLALFKSTSHFFENWIKFMISYTLQIVVVFACIGMWLAVTNYFVGFFNDMSETITPFQKLVSNAGSTDIQDKWGVCPYVLQEGHSGPTMHCSPQGGSPVLYQSASTELIPLSKIPEEGGYVYALTYNLITLILVTYAFSALIKQSPEIAKQLAGPTHVPILGQGFQFNKYGQFKGMMSRSPKAKEEKHGGGLSDLKPGQFVKSFVENSQKQLGRPRNPNA